MKRLPSPLFGLKGLALIVAGISSLSTAFANPNLTNGLVSYWPFDSTNNGLSTPDVQSGYDLFPHAGANTVTFPGHISVVPGKRGNALSFNSANGTVLAYISPLNQWGTPASEVPPTQYPSWTLSFWINGTVANNSGGGQRAVGFGDSQDSSPLWDFAVGGANSIPTTQIDQFVRMNGGSNSLGTLFLNATGGTHSALNANWLDGTWHNITYEANYITNENPIVVSGPFTAPVDGSLTFTFSSMPLDTLAINESNQVNTNQQYLLQQTTDLNSPWVTVATQASAGYGQTTINFGSATNTNGFYRVVGPALRQQVWSIWMDGVLVGSSAFYNATNTAEPAGLPFPNSGTTSVNYLADYGNNPGGSDPAAIQPPLGIWKIDTLAIGGLARNGGTGSYITAALDDVATWKRALSQSEILNYMSDGITNPAGAIPLSISLTADFPAVAVGDYEYLSWQGAQNGTQFTLNPGAINENGNTVSGGGNDNIVVSSNTTFTITETRSGNSVSSSQSVIAVSNVTAGWHYIDSFTYLPTNTIAGQPSSASSIAQWVNPPNGYTLNMLPARVYASSVDSNKYVSFDGQDAVGTGAGEGNGGLAGRHLNNISMPIGTSNTLFFRFYLDPSVNQTDTNQQSQIPDVDCNVGLTDKGFRDIADFDGQNGNNTGPAVYIVRSTFGAGGPIDFQAADGPVNMGLSPAGYSYIDDTNNGDPNGLAVGMVYSVWIDVQNNNAEVAGGVNSGGTQTNGAYYTVWLQREDWPSRTNLFQYITPTNASLGMSYPTGVLVSDRDDSTVDDIEGPTDQTINGLFLAMSAAVAPTETNMLRFDDFYLSTNGYNSTVPVTAGSLAR